MELQLWSVGVPLTAALGANNKINALEGSTNSEAAFPEAASRLRGEPLGSFELRTELWSCGPALTDGALFPLRQEEEH